MARPFTVLALCIIIFLMIRNGLGFGLYALSPAEETLLGGDRVELSGYLNKIEYSKSNILLYLSDSIASFDSIEYPAGTVILKTPTENEVNPGYEIGGLIFAHGKWDELSHATNPGQFDEYSYYKSMGVDGRVVGAIEYEDHSQASYYRTFLAGLRQSLSDSIDRSILCEEDRGLLKAMVLGDRSALDSDLKEAYKKAGIIHLISISGLHITMIGMGLYRLLRRCRQSILRSSLISGLAITGYVFMTGASVSSLRAAISFIILLGAEVLGRTSDALNTLSLAASLLLISDPGLLANSGFLLSFSSVLGISLFISPAPAFSKREKLLSALRAGFGLWLFTLPVILSVYYEFPLYSVFINMVAVALSPALLITGLGGAFAGMVLSPMGDALFLVSGLMMGINKILTRISSALPFSVVIAGRPDMVRIILYYLGLAALVNFRKKQTGKLNHKIIIITCMLALILINPRMETSITFLDVGQGDSILIRCDNGSNIMIDAGSGNVSSVGKNRIIPCLKSYGLGKIDRLILTHPDSDHINAVDEILNSNIEVGEILIAEVHSKDEAIIKLREKVFDKNEYSINKTNIHYIQRGDMFTEGNSTFNVLYPRGESSPEINSVSEPDMELFDENDRNATSIVVEMTCGDTKAIFTGDLEKEGETILVNSGLLEDVDILKVAHHGSKYSTSEELLKLTTPEIAVISCGKKNSYGHPHKETLDRLAAAGCEILTTPECGAIEVYIGREVCYNRTVT